LEIKSTHKAAQRSKPTLAQKSGVRRAPFTAKYRASQYRKKAARACHGACASLRLLTAAPGSGQILLRRIAQPLRCPSMAGCAGHLQLRAE